MSKNVYLISIFKTAWFYYELVEKHLNSSTAKLYIDIKQTWLENPPDERLHSAGVSDGGHSVVAFTVH